MSSKLGPRIVDNPDSIHLLLDVHNPKMKGDGTRGMRRARGRSTNISNSSINIPLLDPTSPNNIQRFSLVVWVEVNAYDTGYAWHPINQWNAGGTSSASIVLYAFQNYQNSGANGNYGFYWHRYNAGGWAGMTIGHGDSKLGGTANKSNFPRKNMFAFTYDVNLNSSNPVMYVNGQFHSSGGSSPYGIGNFNYSNTDLYIYTDCYGNASNPSGCTYVQIVDYMLTADEISTIYNSTKKQHGYG